MKRFVAFVAAMLVLCAQKKSMAQCSGGTNQGTVAYFCLGSSTAASYNVSSGNYYLMHVIGGLSYSVSSSRNGITVRSEDGLSTIATTSGSSLGFSTTFSGMVRIYNCNNRNASHTSSFTGGSNTVDDETASGQNQWIEHYYKRLDATPSAPSNTNAFSRYLGTALSGQAELFSTTYNGNNDGTCINVYSQSVDRIHFLNSYFAVRNRMTSTRTAGVYLADISGDDGIRLSVDGTLVFNRWIEQGLTTYTKEMFSLNGNSDLLLEYYESGGSNELRFQNLSRVSNSIATANQTLCLGSSIPVLSATNTYTTAPISSDSRFTVSYQWQQSSDSISFTNISGATGQNYTPVISTPGIYYYRRIAHVSRTNDGMPTASTLQDVSNVVKYTVLSLPVVNLSGDTTVCQQATAPTLTFSNPQPMAVTVVYTINGGSNQSLNITPSGVGTVSVPTGTAGSYHYVVQSVAYTTTPACTNTSLSVSATIMVAATPGGGLTAVQTEVCAGQQVQLQFTASQGEGPYELLINGAVYTGVQSGGVFNVNPNVLTSTTFDLTKITDSKGCVLQSP